MKLMIVDDEINICKLINRLVDWKALGLVSVGAVQSGEEAIELAHKMKPDIIVTDIRMQGMDGLELIKVLKSKNPDQKFIIISGYKSFRYAYTAIKYGVMDFLLKPINKQELNEALNNVILGIKGQNESQSAMNGAGLSVKGRLRRQFLLNMIHKDIHLKHATYKDINQEYFFNFIPGLFQVCILHMDKSPSAKHVTTDTLSKVYDLFTTQINNLCADFEIVTLNNEIIILFNYEPQMNDYIEKAFQLFMESSVMLVKEYPFLRLTVGTGKGYKEIREVHKSYREANLAILSRLVVGTNRLIDGSGYTNAKNMELSLDNDILQDIRNAIEILALEKIEAGIDRAWESQKPKLKEHPYWGYSYAVNLAKMLTNTLRTFHNEYDIISARKRLYRVVDMNYEIENIMKEVKNEVGVFVEQIGQVKEKNNAKLINVAKKHVKENYGEKITLEDAAGLVYLSPAYFGILFKKETGLNFSEYISRVKIKKAKDFLRNQKYKISEVGEMVGYKDTKYFSKLFRRITGIKPTEYRKIHLLRDKL